jgi:hypothetical protein
MDEFEPPVPNASPLPVADVTAAATGGNVEYEAFPVRKPEQDLNDFKVQVRASTLARCRAKLAPLSGPAFPWHEVCLGVSTMAAGAFLGALPADIKVGSPQAIFFYTILPVIAASALIAYVFLRRLALRDAAIAASEVLSELPDPERTR